MHVQFIFRSFNVVYIFVDIVQKNIWSLKNYPNPFYELGGYTGVIFWKVYPLTMI